MPLSAFPYISGFAGERPQGFIFARDSRIRTGNYICLFVSNVSGLRIKISYGSMNPNLQFRLDREYKDVSGALAVLFNDCEQGFAFEHPYDEKTKKVVHIHGYMFAPVIVRKTLQKHIKALQLSLKNADYETSITCGKDKRPIDMSGSYMYGSRFDELTPKFLKNISPALLEELRLYARNGRPIQSASKSKLEKVHDMRIKDKSAFYDICEAVKAEARETPGVYDNRLVGNEHIEMKSVIVKPVAVYNILLKHLKKHRVMTEVNQLTRFMTTILRDDEEQGEELRKTVFRRIFPSA